ncbi:hypothetical protein DFQ28_005431 [Apophysomyces sp. BC1034]|nr:hypothetical protein DFQ30_010801 [Apophysomyces sp. BC1015]KAG0181080.1 hypothetical protein DFQ29_009395 [Apophysomyces sp. BC1021]KAG0188067.1 hypothetical protein DFQ28_005431 [Apophysomyces sp. BC1034]
MVQDTSRHIFVREVTLDDLKHSTAAHRIINSAYRADKAGGWTTESHIVGGERASVEDVEGYVRDQGKPNVLLYAFQRVDGSDVLVGTVQIQPESDSEAEVGLFAVDPQLQSCGIGGKLIRAALDKMKVLGFEAAVMHVLENRPEILKWYSKLGFEETGERVPFVWPENLKIKDLHFLVLKKKL